MVLTSVLMIKFHSKESDMPEIIEFFAASVAIGVILAHIIFFIAIMFF